MGKGFKKPKKSKIKFDIETNEVEELQRTEKWRLDRLGRWTGSQQKNLMSCSSSGGRLTWNDVEKLFSNSIKKRSQKRP